jgi:multidrug efflux system outer membrane protein
LPRGLRWLAVPLLLALPGCMMGPDYKQPPVDSPTEFRQPKPTTLATPSSPNAKVKAAPGNVTAAGNSTAVPGNTTTTGNVTATGNTTAATPSPASLADLAWWQVYNDPVLQGLLQEALKNNYDVQIAAQSVEQAQQQAYEQQSFLMPQIGYGGTVSRGRNQTLGTLQPLNGSYNSSTSLQLNLSWQIDLWGKLRRADEAARAALLATVEAQRGVWLTLVSDVATTYFQLLGLEAQLQVAKNATQTYTETLNLFEERLQGGVASLLDTSSAAGALGAAAAQIPDIERQIAETENQLSVLLGRNPGPIPRGIVLTSQTFPPNIPAGLPSQLLERRPDILEAAAEVKAENALIGVAKANFFPQLSLTGALGKVSPEVSAFTGGGANAWSIAAGLAGPIFEGGLLTAQYKGAQAAYKQSVNQYKETVIEAFQDVSDALTEREKLAEVRAEQEYSVSSYSEAVDVSIKRYVAGKASYYEVLDAQTKLFPNEANLVNTRVAELLAMVDLYKALGGGWSLKDTTFVDGPTPPIPPVDFASSQPASYSTKLPGPFMAPSNLMGKPQPVAAPTSFKGSVENPTGGTATPASP